MRVIDNYQNWRGLYSAIILQAIKDFHSGKYQVDAETFIVSEGFDWLWMELTEDVIRVPEADQTKVRIIQEGLLIRHGAYHKEKEIVDNEILSSATRF